MTWFSPEEAKASAPSRPVKEVHIVGIGARTSLGDCAASSAAAVRARISSFKRHPFVFQIGGELMVVARIPYLPEELLGVERYLAMALPAFQDALAPIGHLKATPIPVILGLPPSRPGQPEQLGDQLKTHLAGAEQGFCRVKDITVLNVGHASGLMALEAGAERIRSGQCEFCLVGGVDTYMDLETLEWLDLNDQVHGAGIPKNPRGFTPGEGAGFCLLAAGDAMAKHGLTSLSRIVSAAMAREANLIKTDTVCIGSGLSEAFQGALKPIAEGIKIDQLICDQNGEIYRADEFGMTYARSMEHFAEGSGFQVPAQFWGDVGAASGPLFAILAIAAGQKGYAKGPHTLLSASSEGGERAAVILYTEIQITER